MKTANNNNLYLLKNSLAMKKQLIVIKKIIQ